MTLHTENDAKTKWCPFGLTPHFARDVNLSGVVAANRSASTFEDDAAGIPERPIPTCLCIASGCMAWQWHTTTGVADRLGFCGLAGKPEQAS